MAQKIKNIIPLTRPWFGKEEVKAAKEAILSGWITQGPRVEEFEKQLSQYVNSKYACAVSSCTAALHMALLAVGVKPANAVVTVSHSFIATANAIRHCGAEPAFVDIDLDTYNMSSESLERFLRQDCKIIHKKLFYQKRRVAAILAVHQLGMPCNLKDILTLASQFKLPVVEDAACALGSKIKIGSRWERIGRPHGEIACFSFHPRKIITSGEGGMLTTNNLQYDKLFRLLRHHGMSVSDRVRHTADKIIFEEYIISGYNYRMTDIQAAIGIEQLKKLNALIKKRKELVEIYREGLKDIDWLVLPEESKYCRANWQSFQVMLREDGPLGRDELMQYLLDRGVSTRRGVMNAHQEPPYSSYRWNLANSEKARDRCLLLPIFSSLSIKHLRYVINLLCNLKR